MKNKIVFLFVVITVICLSACFSPWMNEDEAVVTIRLGQSGTARSALPWPPQGNDWILEYLEYEIALVSGAETINITANGTDEIIEITVPIGLYEIKVDVYFTGEEFNPAGERIHYATGENTANVRAGVNNPVTVPMHRVYMVSVNPQPPVIVEQPESGTYPTNAEIIIGVKAILQDDGELSYQWYSNTENINTGWTEIEGETKADFNPPGNIAGTFYYYVVVTNTIIDEDGEEKTESVTSDIAIIIVNPPVNAQMPHITSQPSGGNYTLGNPVILNVMAESQDEGILSYQWYVNSSPIQGATNSSYTTQNITGTHYFYVIVTNTIDDNEDSGIKTASVTSNTVTIIINYLVNAQPPEITEQPEGGSCDRYTPIFLSVSAISQDEGDLKYQWFSNTSLSNSGGTEIMEADIEIFYPPTENAGTYFYYVVITNNIDDNGDGGNKSSSVSSNPVSLTVYKNAPEITAPPTAAGITYSAALSTSALTGGTASTEGSFSWTNGETIPTVNNTGYSVTFTPTDTANYNIAIVNVGITVAPAAPNVTWPTNLTATYGQTLGNISLPGNGSGIPAGTFDWVAPLSTLAGNVGQQTHQLRFTVNAANTGNYTNPINSVTVTVAPANPNVTWPSGLTAVYGQTLANIQLPQGNLNQSGTPGSYRWTAGNNTPVGDVGNQQHNVTFTPTDSNNFNTSNNNVTVTVGKVPGVAVGGTPELTSKTHNSITIEALTITDNPGSQSVEYALNTTNSAPSGGWQTDLTFNIGLNPGITYYIFARSQANDTHSAGPASQSLEVTTFSLIEITTQPASVDVFEGSITQSLTVEAEITPEGATLSYQWFRSNSEGNPGDDPVGTGATFEIPPNLTADESPYYYIVQVTAQGAMPVNSSVATVTVNTPPELTGTVSISGTALFGETLTANVTNLGGDGDITYEWRRDENTAIGTNSSIYVLTADDVGKTITVTVTRTNNPGSVTSDPTGIIALIEMVFVLGGSFEHGKHLGTEQGQDINGTKLTHLSNFYIGKYPVTQDQYQAVMGFNPSYHTPANGRPPADGEVQGRRPVEQVNWFAAIVFCNKLSIMEGLTPAYTLQINSGWSTNTDDWGDIPDSNAYQNNHLWNRIQIVPDSNGYRLPTNAQWEYAAKGGTPQDDFSYSGSNDPNAVAWWQENSENKTHEVGKKAPNKLGLYDMTGNVMEWNWDIHQVNYSGQVETDPTGMVYTSGTVNRAVRASSYASIYVFYLNIIGRASGNPFNPNGGVGFRVARSYIAP